MAHIHIEQFAFCLTDLLTNGASKSELLKNPIKLIAKSMELLHTQKHWKVLSGAEKKELLLGALETIAKGRDGVQGTSDDLLPADFVVTIKLMLERNLVSQVIDVVAATAKGHFDIIQAKKVATDVVHVAKTGCIPFIQRFFPKKRV